MRFRRFALGLVVTAPLAAVTTLSACGSDSDQRSTQASATSSAARTDKPDKPTAADEAAVRGLLDKINDAWARGDATAYASFHTPDADLIDFRGTHAVGRQAIVNLLQPAFAGVLKNTTVQARIVDLRFLSDDVAVFHTEGKIVPTGDDSVQTFVTTKGPGGWLIAAFQNTRIQTAG